MALTAWCRRGVLLPCLAAFVLVAAPAARAQVLYGSILGNVVDATGAALPGATVKIEQSETKLTRELVTDAAGAYHFTAVPTGTYTVSIAMSGFRGFKRDVPVTLNSVARVERSSKSVAISETVMVSASPPVLQTDRAEVRRS